MTKTKTINNKTTPSTKGKLEGTLNKEQKEKLRLFADVTDFDVIEEYNTRYGELLAKGVTKNIEQLAINKVANRVRNEANKKNTQDEPKSVPKALQCFIIGDTGVLDKIEKIEKIAKAVAKRDRAEALSKGYINDESEVLDTRENLFGSANVNYHKPLMVKQKDGSFKKVVDMQRTLTLIAKVEGDEKWRLCRLNTNTPKLVKGWSNLPLERFCTTFANVKNFGTPSMILSSSQADETLTVFKACNDKVSFDDAFNEAINEPEYIVTFDTLAEKHTIVKDWDRKFVLEGNVAKIVNERADINGLIKVIVADDDDVCNTIVCKISKDYKLKFDEGSRVIVVGKSEMFDTFNKETKKYEKRALLGINAECIYPIPEFTIPCYEGSNISSSVDECEIPVNGWVEC